ncbi:1-acyl-sn-glycerol-3-phosphate acyltransferase [Candidatus Saccharibacteria bacterium]|nr:1-acyl-sn-glycerol-3-phosphate acyltransferase [Candidatus Saccharibacteria bacterium]
MKPTLYQLQLRYFNSLVHKILLYPLQWLVLLGMRGFMTLVSLTGSIRRTDIINLLDPAVFKRKSPIIFVANHQSKYDSFFTIASLSIFHWHLALPVRSMLHPAAFKNIIGRHALLIFGNYPAKPVKNIPYGLEFTKYAMNKGHSIFIFPEAHRVLPHESQPRTGIEEMLRAYPHALIVPCHIQWYRDHKNRKRYELTIGEAYRPKHIDAKRIMKTVYSLPLPSEIEAKALVEEAQQE